MVTTEQITMHRCSICKNLYITKLEAEQCEQQEQPQESLPKGTVFKHIPEEDMVWYYILGSLREVSERGHRNKYSALVLKLEPSGKRIESYPTEREVIVNRDGQTLGFYDDPKKAPQILSPEDVKECCKRHSIFRDKLQEILEQVA